MGDLALVLPLALLAPFIGSFLGLVVLRLPQGAPVLGGRSLCASCSATLGPRDLVPLASWLLARGRARCCGRAVSAFYPFVELAALALVLWAATVTSGAVLIASCVFGWQLLALGLIDARVYRLPDVLTLVLFVSGLAVTAWLMPGALGDHFIAAAVGFLSLWAIGALYASLRGREGLGLGDAKLLGALGAWLSWQALPSVVLIAGVLGLVGTLASRRLRGTAVSGATRIPLGSYLCAAAWIVWLYGPLGLNE